MNNFWLVVSWSMQNLYVFSLFVLSLIRFLPSGRGPFSVAPFSSSSQHIFSVFSAIPNTVKWYQTYWVMGRRALHMIFHISLGTVGAEHFCLQQFLTGFAGLVYFVCLFSCLLFLPSLSILKHSRFKYFLVHICRSWFFFLFLFYFFINPKLAGFLNPKPIKVTVY